MASEHIIARRMESLFSRTVSLYSAFSTRIAPATISSLPLLFTYKLCVALGGWGADYCVCSLMLINWRGVSVGRGRLFNQISNFAYVLAEFRLQRTQLTCFKVMRMTAKIALLTNVYISLLWELHSNMLCLTLTMWRAKTRLLIIKYLSSRGSATCAGFFVQENVNLNHLVICFALECGRCAPPRRTGAPRFLLELSNHFYSSDFINQQHRPIWRASSSQADE